MTESPTTVLASIFYAWLVVHPLIALGWPKPRVYAHLRSERFGALPGGPK